MQVHQIDFYGARLFGVRNDAGVVIIPIKPICDAVEIDWSSQHHRIQRDRVLAKGIAVTTIPYGVGGAQEMLCLPLTRLNYWLATINADRIRNEAIREAVWLYKEECADVLAAYFLTGQLPPNPNVRANLLQDDLFVRSVPDAPSVPAIHQRVTQLEHRFGDVERIAYNANRKSNEAFVNSLRAEKIAQGHNLEIYGPPDPNAPTESGLPRLVEARTPERRQ